MGGSTLWSFAAALGISSHDFKCGPSTRETQGLDGV